MKLIYDTVSIPEHFDMEMFNYWIEEKGVVWWDSMNGGKAPILIEDCELIIKDTQEYPLE